MQVITKHNAMKKSHSLLFQSCRWFAVQVHSASYWIQFILKQISFRLAIIVFFLQISSYKRRNEKIKYWCQNFFQKVNRKIENICSVTRDKTPLVVSVDDRTFKNFFLQQVIHITNIFWAVFDNWKLLLKNITSAS